MSVDFYMTHTATITAVSSYNRYGDRTMGTPVGTACRMEPEKKIIRKDAEQTVMSQATVFLPSSTTIDVDDQLLYNGRTYEVLEVVLPLGWTEVPNHKEVYLK